MAGSAWAGPVSQVLDFQSARTLGLSGGGRASPQLADTVVVNPSALAFQEFQGLSATYDWLNHKEPAVGSTTQRVLNASVIDGRNPYVTGGVSYTRRPDLDIIHVGVGRKVVLDWLAVGATVKRYQVRPAYQCIAGGDSGFDGGVSATISPNPMTVALPFQFGITGDNLIMGNQAEKFLGGRKLGAGLKLNLKEILYPMVDYARVMGNNTPSFSVLSFGGETTIGGGLFARGSLMRMGRKGWGVGGSWMAPKIGFNYGYQRRSDPDDGFEHAVTVDFFI